MKEKHTLGKQEQEYIDHAKEIICKEIDALESIKDSIDHYFAEAVNILAHCSGKVIFLGIGKSGHIAKKISSTFSSLGTPAFFINSAEALHGDLGSIDSDDVAIIISHSGEGCEIEPCLTYLHHIGCTTIAITGCANSTLGLYAHLTLTIPVHIEACSLGVAPTASTTAALALGDALAIIISEVKHFSIKEFQKRHPGGNLGKTLQLVTETE